MESGLLKLSPFQHQLHTVRDYKNPDDDRPDTLCGILFPVRGVYEHSVPVVSKLDSSISNSDNDEERHHFSDIKYVTSYDGSCQCIDSLGFRAFLPTIKVKPEHEGKVKIAWTPGIVHAMIEESEAIIGTKSRFGYINRHILNDIMHYMNDRDAKQTYEEAIGNIPALTAWQSVLMEKKLCPPILFDFVLYRTPFPLLLHSSDVISFKFKLRTYIPHLLRMKVLTDDNKWRVLSAPNMNFVDIVGAKNGFLKSPILYMQGRKLSADSIEFYLKDMFMRTKTVNNKQVDDVVPVRMYFNDRACKVSQNPHNVGESASMELGFATNSITGSVNTKEEISEPKPTTIITWMAENVTALNSNCYNNYTCRSDSIEDGEDIITNHKLHIRNANIFDLGNDMFSWTEFNRTSRPRVRGIYSWVFSGIDKSLNIGSGIPLTDKDIVSVNIGVPNESRKIDRLFNMDSSVSNFEDVPSIHTNSETLSTDKYNLITILTYTRCITYRREGDTIKYELN